jgi:hypothetical protein
MPDVVSIPAVHVLLALDAFKLSLETFEERLVQVEAKEAESGVSMPATRGLLRANIERLRLNVARFEGHAKQIDASGE